jgi:diacylglycerol kinase (ATP)
MIGHAMRDAMRQRWETFTAGDGTANLRAAIFDQLWRAYKQPHRHYRTMRHVVSCLEQLAPVRAQCDEPDAVEAAIWFHDAVFDTRFQPVSATRGYHATMTETNPPFTFSGRLRSMRFACRGIRTMLVSQHNAWLHAFATIVVCAAGAGLGISRGEWCAVVIAIVAVWTAEALNTSLELLCDVASPGFHPSVEKAKDVAAGGVLISALGAVVVGLLVFVPRLLSLSLGGRG